MTIVDGGPATRCPSAQPRMADAEILGVVGREEGEPRVEYVNGHMPATADVLGLAAPLPPTEVFRLSAHCEERRCTHFDGERCQLAVRIVDMLPEVTAWLPPCNIRRTCRWYAQEGRAACLRCPQVVTSNGAASDLIARVAGAGQAGEPAPAAEAVPGAGGG